MPRPRAPGGKLARAALRRASSPPPPPRRLEADSRPELSSSIIKLPLDAAEARRKCFTRAWASLTVVICSLTSAIWSRSCELSFLRAARRAHDLNIGAVARGRTASRRATRGAEDFHTVQDARGVRNAKQGGHPPAGPRRRGGRCRQQPNFFDMRLLRSRFGGIDARRYRHVPTVEPDPILGAVALLPARPRRSPRPRRRRSRVGLPSRLSPGRGALEHLLGHAGSPARAFPRRRDVEHYFCRDELGRHWGCQAA